MHTFYSTIKLLSVSVLKMVQLFEHVFIVHCYTVLGVYRSLAMGRSSVQGVLSKCLNGSTASEVNSESEQDETYKRELPL